ncbi:hypothetical protein Aduo_004904 [Ancylostoma duodenale]
MCWTTPVNTFGSGAETGTLAHSSGSKNARELDKDIISVQKCMNSAEISHVSGTDSQHEKPCFNSFSKNQFVLICKPVEHVSTRGDDRFASVR